jgi:hypothetical protein
MTRGRAVAAIRNYRPTPQKEEDKGSIPLAMIALIVSSRRIRLIGRVCHAWRCPGPSDTGTDQHQALPQYRNYEPDTAHMMPGA